MAINGNSNAEQCNFFKTEHFRPLLSKFVTTTSDELIEDTPLAIVIQGPVSRDCDYTLETIRLYNKHFSNTKIILSTWDDEDKNYLELFKRENVEVVLSQKPSFIGITNVNLQIESTTNGIKKAQELGFEYVIKTRTDQRIYSTNIKEFLFNILKTFPLKEGIEIQKQRLVACSLNTFKYRLYGISDMFLFGHIDDMILYWCHEHDTRNFDEVREKSEKSIKDYCECRLCEVYFSTEFLKKINRTFNFTLKESWQIYADNFCVIDQESLDLCWPKYTNREFRRLIYAPYFLEELTFKEWFNLYTGLDNKKYIPEEFLNNKPM